MPGECDHLADMAGFREGKLSRPGVARRHEHRHTHTEENEGSGTDKKNLKPPRYDRSSSEDWRTMTLQLHILFSHCLTRDTRVESSFISLFCICAGMKAVILILLQWFYSVTLTQFGFGALVYFFTTT